MKTGSPKLDLSIQAFHLMTNKRWEGGDCFGGIERTEDNCRLIEILQEEDVVYPPGTEAFKPDPGKFCEIQLQPPRNESAFFAKSLDDLLNHPKYLYSLPLSFFIADTNECFPSKETPSGSLRGYIDVVDLIKILKSFCDHFDSSGGQLRLVFLQKEKLEITVCYSKEALSLLPCLTELKNILSERVHYQQRRAILKKILLEELRLIEVKDRFVVLIKSINRIYQRFLDNYQLYVSEFSFDSIYKEISGKRLDYILKINKNFTDIQNQLLAVPLAALLAWSQMGKNAHLKNWLVFVTSLVFSLFLSMLIRNQKASLSAIKDEIKDQEKSLCNEYAALAPHFEKIYSDLFLRCRKHKWLLRSVDASVAVIIVVIPATLLFFFSITQYW